MQNAFVAGTTLDEMYRRWVLAVLVKHSQTSEQPVRAGSMEDKVYPQVGAGSQGIGQTKWLWSSQGGEHAGRVVPQVGCWPSVRLSGIWSNLGSGQGGERAGHGALQVGAGCHTWSRLVVSGAVPSCS